MNEDFKNTVSKNECQILALIDHCEYAEAQKIIDATLLFLAEKGKEEPLACLMMTTVNLERKGFCHYRLGDSDKAKKFLNMTIQECDRIIGIFSRIMNEGRPSLYQSFAPELVELRTKAQDTLNRIF